MVSTDRDKNYNNLFEVVDSMRKIETSMSHLDDTINSFTNSSPFEVKLDSNYTRSVDNFNKGLINNLRNNVFKVEVVNGSVSNQMDTNEFPTQMVTIMSSSDRTFFDKSFKSIIDVLQGMSTSRQDDTRERNSLVEHKRFNNNLISNINSNNISSILGNIGGSVGGVLGGVTGLVGGVLGTLVSVIMSAITDLSNRAAARTRTAIQRIRSEEEALNDIMWEYGLTDPNTAREYYRRRFNTPHSGYLTEEERRQLIMPYQKRNAFEQYEFERDARLSAVRLGYNTEEKVTNVTNQLIKWKEIFEDINFEASELFNQTMKFVDKSGESFNAIMENIQNLSTQYMVTPELLEEVSSGYAKYMRAITNNSNSYTRSMNSLMTATAKLENGGVDSRGLISQLMNYQYSDIKNASQNRLWRQLAIIGMNPVTSMTQDPGDFTMNYATSMKGYFKKMGLDTSNPNDRMMINTLAQQVFGLSPSEMPDFYALLNGDFEEEKDPTLEALQGTRSSLEDFINDYNERENAREETYYKQAGQAFTYITEEMQTENEQTLRDLISPEFQSLVDAENAINRATDGLFTELPNWLLSLAYLENAANGNSTDLINKTIGQVGQALGDILSGGVDVLINVFDQVDEIYGEMYTGYDTVHDTLLEIWAAIKGFGSGVWELLTGGNFSSGYNKGVTSVLGQPIGNGYYEYDENGLITRLVDEALGLEDSRRSKKNTIISNNVKETVETLKHNLGELSDALDNNNMTEYITGTITKITELPLDENYQKNLEEIFNGILEDVNNNFNKNPDLLEYPNYEYNLDEIGSSINQLEGIEEKLIGESTENTIQMIEQKEQKEDTQRIIGNTQDSIIDNTDELKNTQDALKENTSAINEAPTSIGETIVNGLKDALIDGIVNAMSGGVYGLTKNAFGVGKYIEGLFPDSSDNKSENTFGSNDTKILNQSTKSIEESSEYIQGSNTLLNKSNSNVYELNKSTADNNTKVYNLNTSVDKNNENTYKLNQSLINTNYGLNPKVDTLNTNYTNLLDFYGELFTKDEENGGFTMNAAIPQVATLIEVIINLTEVLSEMMEFGFGEGEGEHTAEPMNYQQSGGYTHNGIDFGNQTPVGAGTYNPFSKYNLTSMYGQKGRNHKGIDLLVPYGTKLPAIQTGYVIGTGYDSNYGNYIDLQGIDGYTYRYAHLNRIDVKKGQLISQKDIIGISGTSGNSSSPHLHMEVMNPDGQYIDPAIRLRTGILETGPIKKDSDAIEKVYNNSGVKIQKELANQIDSGMLIGSSSAKDKERSYYHSFNNNNLSSIDSSNTQLYAYNYLKNKGYDDVHIAGILGNWMQESGVNPVRLEADFTNWYKDYGDGTIAGIINNPEALNKYAEYVINHTGAIKDKNYALNTSYRGSDGNLYPGIGLGQWTGDRGRMLMEYAKSHGRDPLDIATQLDFMFNGDDPNRIKRLETYKDTEFSDTDSATKYFLTKWEGVNYDLAERQAAASSIFTDKMNEWDKETSQLISANANSTPPNNIVVAYTDTGSSGLEYNPNQGLNDTYLASSSKGYRDTVIEFALNQKGKPYVYGAVGPNSYDCSGFVTAALEEAGVSTGSRLTTSNMKNNVTKISSYDGLKPGDILMANNGKHTGIYIGDGKVVHASSGKGEVIEVPYSTYWYAKYEGTPSNYENDESVVQLAEENGASYIVASAQPSTETVEVSPNENAAASPTGTTSTVTSNSPNNTLNTAQQPTSQTPTVSSPYQSPAKTDLRNQQSQQAQPTNTTGPKRQLFASGGKVTSPTLSLMGEAGYDEYVISTDPQYASKSYDLIDEVSSELGYTRSILSKAKTGETIVTTDVDVESIVRALKALTDIVQSGFGDVKRSQENSNNQGQKTTNESSNKQRSNSITNYA